MQALAHVFGHQTHHRGQTHALLTRLTGDALAPDLPAPDLIDPLREPTDMSAQKTWWAEDFIPGLTFETPGFTMTEAAIINYAMMYDPQPFHTDVTAAEASIYGGLIASGFHTLSTAFRLWQGMGIINPASQGAPGMDELVWKAPVRPGDTIRGVVKVTSQRMSASRPTLGIIGWRTEVFNQRDELVMSFAGPAMYLRRPENRGA